MVAVVPIGTDEYRNGFVTEVIMGETAQLLTILLSQDGGHSAGQLPDHARIAIYVSELHT